VEVGGSGASGDVQVPESDSAPGEHPPRGRRRPSLKTGPPKPIATRPRTVRISTFVPQRQGTGPGPVTDLQPLQLICPEAAVQRCDRRLGDTHRRPRKGSVKRTTLTAGQEAARGHTVDRSAACKSYPRWTLDSLLRGHRDRFALVDDECGRGPRRSIADVPGFVDHSFGVVIRVSCAHAPRFAPLEPQL
jgi:hypothetical protein